MSALLDCLQRGVWKGFDPTDVRSLLWGAQAGPMRELIHLIWLARAQVGSGQSALGTSAVWKEFDPTDVRGLTRKDAWSASVPKVPRGWGGGGRRRAAGRARCRGRRRFSSTGRRGRPSRRMVRGGPGARGPGCAPLMRAHRAPRRRHDGCGHAGPRARCGVATRARPLRIRMRAHTTYAYPNARPMRLNDMHIPPSRSGGEGPDEGAILRARRRGEACKGRQATGACVSTGAAAAAARSTSAFPNGAAHRCSRRATLGLSRRGASTTRRTRRSATSCACARPGCAFAYWQWAIAFANGARGRDIICALGGVYGRLHSRMGRAVFCIRVFAVVLEIAFSNGGAGTCTRGSSGSRRLSDASPPLRGVWLLRMHSHHFTMKHDMQA